MRQHICPDCEQDRMLCKCQIEKAIKRFPPTFGLRAYPGETFQISHTASYMSEGQVMLYLMVKREDGWQEFCKGTITELQQNIVSMKGTA